MSTGPKSSDNLQLLKELMLGDEQREIVELRERFETLETGSVERLSRDLAAAVELRNRMGDASFDELVAALQAGTESAIQRSVREDKSRLSKALFPIMGPAIRSYVIELFRTMVEDLNETVRNTTSFERLKWRFEAKTAGVPFSDYVMMKTANYRVEEVFLMQRDSGMLLQHVAADPEDEAEDADLVSGMFTAIRSFVRDSFGSDGDEEQPEELKRFTFGERQVLIEDGPSMVLAAVVRGTPTPAVRDQLKATLEELQHRYQEVADHFSGDVAETVAMRPLLHPCLTEHTPVSGKPGGALWRAWLLIGALVLGIGAWIGWGIWKQQRWNRFETALREQPGIEVIDVKKQRGHRTVVGLRDPLAETDPPALAASHGIDPDSVAYRWTELPLPAFAESRRAAADREWNERRAAVISEIGGNIESARREIESTRQEVKASADQLGSAMDRWLGSAKTDLGKRLTDLETKHRESIVDLIRSRYGHLEDLRFELNDEGLAVAGSAPMPEYVQLKNRLGTIRSLGSVDTSGLENATEARVARLLADLGEAGILYESGTLTQLDPESVPRVGRLARDLVTESGKLGRRYQFDVIAYPLIGELREGNRPIEEKRADLIRNELIEAGIPPASLKAIISEDMTRAGDGVSLLPKLVPAAP